MSYDFFESLIPSPFCVMRSPFYYFSPQRRNRVVHAYDDRLVYSCNINNRIYNSSFDCGDIVNKIATPHTTVSKRSKKEEEEKKKKKE
jgi:hypothetical protein